MTPQQLRNSILQQAIEGKLVEQRKEEGTAEELYAQIQEEKRKLITEGKIKKEKPLPEITEDEIPFDIPESWKWVRLGNLLINRDSERIPLSVAERDKLDKVYDYYGASGVIDKVDNYIFDKKLLLIGEDGANLLTRSKPIAFLAEGKFWVNNHAHVLDCVKSYTLLEYVMYYINSISLASYVTGTAQPKMNQEKMNSILVPLPPFEEQKRIVAKIEELLPFIDKYEKAYNALEKYNARFPDEMRKSILQQAIEGKLVEQRPEEGTAEELYAQIQEEKKKLIAESKIKKEKPLPEISEDEIPFDIPESWKWVRLKEIVYNHGQKQPTSEFSYIEINSIDNIHQKLSDSEQIVTAEKAPSRARKIVKKGDIIYSTVRPYLHNMCIIDREFEKEPIASTGFAVMSCIQGICNKYLFYFLLSPEFDNYANDNENSKGVAYPAINDTRLFRALVPLPPQEEQKRIVSKIEELLPYCDKLN